ncbi:MAG: O-methyltransferase [Abditibacteriales bacterium]|nr:O-methyltransferase [Abditibacteriales bacterium]
MHPMDFAQINQYLTELTNHPDPLLRRLEEEARQTRFPIIGAAAGRFCYLITRLVKARTVFELGSGFGYSTLWFAKAVRDNGGGKVYHNVWDEGLSRRARQYFAEAGLSDLVEFHVGEAVAALRRAEGPFDVIFNDIDKQGYPASLPVIKEKLKVGGVLIVDNMLWQGRVLDPNDQEPTTQAIRLTTQQIFNDPDFVPTLVPIRDGLVVAMKIDE